MKLKAAFVVMTRAALFFYLHSSQNCTIRHKLELRCNFIILLHRQNGK